METISADALAHPTLFRRPFDDPAWLFELKHDGFRALAHKRGRELTLCSRNGRSLLGAFPEIAIALRDLNVDVFDGELVVPDENGRPDWHELRRRSRMTLATSILQAAVQSGAVLCVFDVLVAGSKDVRARSQLQRKRWLQDHLPEVGGVRVLGHVERDGTALFAQAVEADLEGIVGKRADAPYTAGRHDRWVKIKNGDYSRQETLRWRR